MFPVPVSGELPQVTPSTVWQLGVPMGVSAPVCTMAAERIGVMTGRWVADCDCPDCRGMFSRRFVAGSARAGNSRGRRPLVSIGREVRR